MVYVNIMLKLVYWLDVCNLGGMGFMGLRFIWSDL